MTIARADDATKSASETAKKTPKATWQEKLWGGPAKQNQPLQPEDLPSRVDFESATSMFNTRRTLLAKASVEPRLRCTEVDESGKVILVDGEFKKTELIAKVSLAALLKTFANVV